MSLECFDELRRDLEDAQRALTELDGIVTTVKVDPNNPASVEEAIQQIEDAIDSKVAPYGHNPLVSQIVETTKERFREDIRQAAPNRN